MFTLATNSMIDATDQAHKYKVVPELFTPHRYSQLF
jgi:hypothetical protein